MKEHYGLNETYERVDALQKGEYEHSRFQNCDLSDQDLTDMKFIDCTFQNCNLSMAKIDRSAFRNVQFIDCKMLGMRFDNCNAFGLSMTFDGCQLRLSSFYKLRLKKMVFKNTQLQEVDFTESDLTGVLFDQCNLEQAVFEYTILEEADFRNAYHYVIDPENNRLRKAKFSVMGVSGLLEKYDIEIEPINGIPS